MIASSFMGAWRRHHAGIPAASPLIEIDLQKRCYDTWRRCRTSAPPDWLLITTTSAPLASRVTVGAFASRLFYLLNAIHITV